MPKINALADGIVQKSDGKMTKEQAIDRVLQSDPYNEYINEKA